MLSASQSCRILIRATTIRNLPQPPPHRLSTSQEEAVLLACTPTSLSLLMFTITNKFSTSTPPSLVASTRATRTLRLSRAVIKQAKGVWRRICHFWETCLGSWTLALREIFWTILTMGMDSSKIAQPSHPLLSLITRLWCQATPRKCYSNNLIAIPKTSIPYIILHPVSHSVLFSNPRTSTTIVAKERAASAHIAPIPTPLTSLFTKCPNQSSEWTLIIQIAPMATN